MTIIQRRLLPPFVQPGIVPRPSRVRKSLVVQRRPWTAFANHPYPLILVCWEHSFDQLIGSTPTASLVIDLIRHRLIAQAQITRTGTGLFLPQRHMAVIPQSLRPSPLVERKLHHRRHPSGVRNRHRRRQWRGQRRLLVDWEGIDERWLNVLRSAEDISVSAYALQLVTGMSFASSALIRHGYVRYYKEMPTQPYTTVTCTVCFFMHQNWYGDIRLCTIIDVFVSYQMHIFMKDMNHFSTCH